MTEQREPEGFNGTKPPASTDDDSSADDLAPDTSEPWLYYGPETRIPLPDSYFDSIFPASLSVKELESALEDARIRMSEMWLVLADQRYEMGLHELRKRPPIVDGEPAYPVAVASGKTPVLSIKSTPTDPENLHVVWLPFDEYPELYEIRDEWAYLGNRVVKAKKQKAGQ